MSIAVLLFCSLISCFIVVGILFQFLDGRYLKSCKNHCLYVGVYFVSVCVLTAVNMQETPYLNVGAHMVLFGIISFTLYFEKGEKSLVRVLEAEILCIIMAVSEGIGVFFIDALLKALDIFPQNQEMLQGIETVFSKLTLLILYNAVFNKLWKKSLTRTAVHYVLYIVLFAYSMADILVVAAISDREKPLIMMFDICSTFFANVYLLYFFRLYDEREYYRLQVEMMEQQQRLQYEGYELQKEKYAMAVSVLHDVDKHIKMMENLYREELKKDAFEYVGRINEMLRPLIPLDYTGSPILNCLLSDKVSIAQKQGIDFQINVGTVDVGFMEPIDITTLFGNLIDNAITASSKCKDKKYVRLDADTYNDMLSVRIQNSVCEPVPIDHGRLDYITMKSNGIGLMNIQHCVESYYGSILYKNKDGLLICDILLNRKGDGD